MKLALVAPALLVLPAASLASGGEGLGSLISVAPGSMLYTLITFALLLIILWKFAWGPIVKGLEQREESIHGAIEKAQTDREEAEKLLKGYEEKLKTASSEIADRLSKADKEAQARVEQAKEQAREEGEKLIAKAKQEIESQKDKVSAELKAEVADLAASIAAAAISESFDGEDQLRIIKRRLEQVENPS
jgi:F-type H+-transporting ATPase subunit b